MVNVKVVWFDALKGIGEGKTQTGDIVFLNSIYAVSNGHFTALKTGDIVCCEVKLNNQNGFCALKILKTEEARKDFNKTTFIEPHKLPQESEPSL